MINIIFCGYREWALQVFSNFETASFLKIIDVFKTQDDFINQIEKYPTQDIDIILFLGWSWIIPKEITEKYLCLGVHPSDLPDYRGGSPIQNQIINGITHTKLTLMTLSSSKIDAGEIWLKVDLDLSGSTIFEIFSHITDSSIKLLSNFFTQYPNISPKSQDLSEGSYYKRRKPEDSRIKIEDFNQKSLKEIYNFVRCLTDPYPNAYIEDEKGNKLIFKHVVYQQSQNT